MQVPPFSGYRFPVRFGGSPSQAPRMSAAPSSAADTLMFGGNSSLKYLGDKQLGSGRITQKVSVLGNLTANKTMFFDKVSVVGDFKAVNCPLIGSVSVVGDFEATNCVEIGLVSTVGDFEATNCDRVGPVSVVGDFEASNCDSIASIEAGSLSLTNTTVQGDVNTQTSPAVIKSTIGGMLTATGREMRLTQSTIGAIRFKMGKEGAGTPGSKGDLVLGQTRVHGETIKGDKVITGDNVRGSITVGDVTGSNDIAIGTGNKGKGDTITVGDIVGSNGVRIGSGGQASITREGNQLKIVVFSNQDVADRGFTVEASGTFTFVTTPEGYIYRNGKLNSYQTVSMSEQEKADLQDFDKYIDSYNKNRKEEGKEPLEILIDAPGWPDKYNQPSEKAQSASAVDNEQTAQAPTQVITLNNTTVNGDIDFEGKNGLVILIGNAQVKGDVIGGKSIRK